MCEALCVVAVIVNSPVLGDQRKVLCEVAIRPSGQPLEFWVSIL